MTTGKDKTAFAVSGFDHFLGGLIDRYPELWIRLGNLETWALSDEIAPVEVEAPIYVSGLARAGTTIALEILAAHEDVATHLYRDFPPVYTPYWWNWFVERSRRGTPVTAERAHGDGIMITPDSPEAREEVIWMAFFRQGHDPLRSNVLDRGDGDPRFERFYRDHIRKLLAARGRRRYLSKGNYNVTRLGYLHDMFPDARFVIPVRDPVRHIASLMRQHERFRQAEQRNRRALDYMRRVGHFEFGLDMRPINTGSAERATEIMELWHAGDAVRGWARYWAQVYAYIADKLDADAALGDAAMILRYEDLCDRPGETIGRMLAHCRLTADAGLLAGFEDQVAPPTYYRPDFTDEDLAVIAGETGEVAARFGY